MTKIFMVIYGEEKTWQEPLRASAALKPASSSTRTHTVAAARATVLTEQQTSAGAECCAALAMPRLLTASQGASAQTAAPLTLAIAVASAWSSTRGQRK